MFKFAYFATELALATAIPALLFYSESLVATFARVLCILLLALSFACGVQGDRFSSLGFLFALFAGAGWTALMFGDIAYGFMGVAVLLPVVEIVVRRVARRTDHTLILSGEYIAPRSSHLVSR